MMLSGRGGAIVLAAELLLVPVSAISIVISNLNKGLTSRRCQVSAVATLPYKLEHGGAVTSEGPTQVNWLGPFITSVGLELLSLMLASQWRVAPKTSDYCSISLFACVCVF